MAVNRISPPGVFTYVEATFCYKALSTEDNCGYLINVEAKNINSMGKLVSCFYVLSN